MAYIPDRGVIVLEIAKSGSRTLCEGARRVTGQKHLPAEGHHDIAASIRKSGAENPKVIALIRDPADRLVSAFNHHFAGINPDLDDCFRIAKANGPNFNAAFQTQASYLRSDGLAHDLRLYPLERIDEALAFMGCEKRLHRNAARHGWTPEDIRTHPAFGEILGWYECDAKLRDELSEISST